MNTARVRAGREKLRAILKVLAQYSAFLAFLAGIAFVLVGLSRISDWVEENISNRTILAAFMILWALGCALALHEKLRDRMQEEKGLPSEERDPASNA